MASSSEFDKPLPSDLDAERFVLGSLMLRADLVATTSDTLRANDFLLEKHRRIYARIVDIHDRGDGVDRVTVANELRKFGQLESVDGLTYLASLDAGIPQVDNIESYIRILREKSALREIIRTGQRMIEQALVAEQSPSEILESVQPQLQEIEGSTGNQDDGGERAIEVITNFPGGIDAFLDPTKRAKGLLTGFHKLDEMTSGLHPGEIVIIAAATSQGKTNLVLNIAQHLTMHPLQRRHVALFSLEMSSSSLMSRMVCSLARVDQHRFRNGMSGAEERHRLQEALNTINEAQLRLYDNSAMSFPEIAKRIRKLVKEDGLDLAAIDYLQLIATSGRESNRNNEISQLSRNLKLLAKECGIPIIVLSQLSRAYARRTDFRPQLSDLRDSGCLSVATTKLFHSGGVQGTLTSRMNTYSLNNSSKFVPRVSKHIDNGVKGMIRLTLRSGRFIDCTPNHPILTDRGFVAAESITRAHSIAAAKCLPEPAGVKEIPEARWIGWMLGNGSAVGYGSPGCIFSCKELADKFVETTTRLFGVQPKPHPHKCEKVWQYDITASSVRTPEGNPVRNWLKAHDLWGRKSFDKRIPDWFMEQADNASLIQLVAGLWETDGTVTRGMLKFTTTSNELAWQMVWVMARIGIFCFIDDGYMSTSARRKLFTISISDANEVAKFKATIPMAGRKGESLQAIPELRRPGSNFGDRLGLWVPERIAQSKQASGLSWSKLGYRCQEQRISQADLAKVLGKLPDLQPELGWLVSPHIYWDMLQKVEAIGPGPVFDREVVGGPHNFVANGIIVHNSIEQDADMVWFIFREEVYKRDREDLRGLADLIIAKQRNGPIGTVPLRFLGNIGRFENRSEDME